MLLVQHHVNIDDAWLETVIVGIYSDHFWAERGIQECINKILADDPDVLDWEELVEMGHSFETKELAINRNVWP